MARQVGRPGSRERFGKPGPRKPHSHHCSLCRLDYECRCRCCAYLLLRDHDTCAFAAAARQRANQERRAEVRRAEVRWRQLAADTNGNTTGTLGGLEGVR